MCETKEDSFLGLEEDWKEWLRPSEKHQITNINDDDSLSEVLVKNEIKIEEGLLISEEKNPSKQNQVNKTQTNSISFQTTLTTGFTALFTKEEAYEDITTIFKESPLQMEKQSYHRKIFWEVLKNNNSKAKLKDFQQRYVDLLQKVTELQIFKCSLCSDYQSMHEENVKSHLWLVHGTDLNIKTFKCNICNFEKAQKHLMQKHILTHDLSEQSDDKEFESESNCDEPLINLKFKKKKKMSRAHNIVKNKERKNSKECDLCDFKGDSLETLREHQLEHQPLEKNSTFLCYLCSYENSNKVKLKWHLYEKHQIKAKNFEKLVKRWQCEKCDYNTNLKKSFEIHILSHKEPEEIEYFYCANCDFKTKHKGYLRHHFLLKHKDPSEVVKKYMCEICSHRFRVRAKLKIHMLTHKTLSELSKVEKCTECNYQTKTKAALYTHMELHRAPKYVCDLCGHQSRRKWNHEMHLLTHKKDNDTEIFRCTVCSYKTKFKARFKLHQQRGNHFGTASRKLRGTGGPQAMDQSFSDNLKFNCFVCNFETMHRKIFTEHSKTHDNFEEVMKKRFVCELCGFRAHHKTHLHTHSITHKTIDQVEPLKCEKCDFVTKSFHSLASHRQLHKDPKVIYTCEVCGLKNRRKYNHDVHLMTHKSSAEVPMIKCDLCTYQTKFKAYLREHLKKRHHIYTAKKPGRPHADKAN